ncbi:MAG: efflux RND transporter periplasmic adaptor subunit [Thermodesulfobacteriota bacterium]
MQLPAPRRPLSFFAPAALFLALACLLTTGCEGKKEEKAAAPPIPVLVAEVTVKDVPLTTEWVGSLDGFVNATIRAQVTGYLRSQEYREGEVVEAGRLLFTIDPRLFKAAVDQAEAALEGQKALWQTAKQNLDRIRPLAQQNAVSQKDLDDAVGGESQARAAVVQAEASLEKTRLDLGFTSVLSPVRGIAGTAKAQIGDLVGPGSVEELTTVSTVDPIKAYVPLSEQEYLRFAAEGGHAERIPLTLILANGSVHPYTGHFAFAGRQINPQTGTITVTCLFPNPDFILRPGQFARVRAVMRIQKNAILVPQRAVMEMQGTYLAATVGADNRASLKKVAAGDRMGDLWLITDGLAPGDTVVVEGLQKIRDGATVAPKPYVPDKNENPGAPAAQ